MKIEGVPGTEDEAHDSHFHDQYYDGVGEDESNDDIDKAEWTNSETTAAFCSLSVEEITAGNRSNGFMTARGYNNIAIKFEQNRGLRHSRIQFKNRWEELKRFYSFWLWLNKQTGLGRSPSGGIVASDEFWKKHTKGHAAWRKLKYGPPENLSELEIMFEHTAVDGSTSCVAGEQMDDEVDFGEEGGDEADVTPLSVSNKKRSSNNTATVISPKKKIKSPMVRIMKGMYEEMKETNAAAQKAMQDKVVQAEKVLQEKKDSIAKCMSLAVENGALEGSAEHFMAGTLFVKEEHRQVFLTITTSPGRLAFLKRWCRAKNVE
ncbi:L10-interacting MYB domain-containing protein-like [Hordeum vulgare subsp. vulgare]|uniref:L10-interacting MYB domain-containing protein-like n=1 Tax=Hordeum vulgare subsp. vulgare TaxID=112509 RepID=UPI001D1A3408|nr:L10-interacting MYB domain-containing protein-like [Hordeum vulgare subsp. vulgare]